MRAQTGSYGALAQPIIHHRTKAFQAIFAELSQRLQRVFGTAGPVLSIAGSGTTAFEAAQVSLIEPGRKALTIAGGKFGERWQDIYEAYGVEQVRIDVPWGDAADPGRVEQALKETKRPVWIDFVVAPEEDVWPMVPAGAAIHEMIDESTYTLL